MAASAEQRSGVPGTAYQFRPGPFGSHTLLFTLFPEHGQGRRVLDLGCGQGYLSAILASRGYNVTGLEKPGSARKDSFPASVTLAEADLDLDGLPPLGRFDFILCADVLEHLREPRRILSQIHGALEPGGRLIASLPNSGNIYFRLNVLAGRFPADDTGLFDRTHLHFYTWKGWRELFAQSGFSMERIVPTGIPVGLALPRWGSSPPIRAAERLCFVAARLWKKMFAYQFLVAARPEGAS